MYNVFIIVSNKKILLVIERKLVGSIHQQFCVIVNYKLQVRKGKQKTLLGVVPSLADFWTI